MISVVPLINSRKNSGPTFVSCGIPKFVMKGIKNQNDAIFVLH